MAPERQVYSIKELNRYIRMKLDSDVVLSDVWVRGEISNFTHHGSGHMYFTLKDESSRIKSIMFASHNQRLPFVPKEGTKVIARGNVTVYERDGQYQFYATHMQPDGIGSLYLAYEQLKNKLELEGLFAAARKRPLPRFPRCIGVVTSPTGAAVRDIIITLQRRFPQVAVVLYPVLVQGKGAGPSIVKAIQNLNAMGEADVLIVGRGGGSLEELWAFNEEAVARAIAASGIPVISAVGHETDFTIADFAADLRAATPTAAAELAVPHAAELAAQLRTAQQRLRQGLLRRSQRSGERLASLQRSLALVGPRRQLAQHAQRLDMLRAGLLRAARDRHGRAREQRAVLHHSLQRFHPQASVSAARRRTESLTRELAGAMQVRLQEKRSRFAAELRHLDALSPLKVMSRGYSLVYDEKEEHLIKSLKEVELGDVVNIKLNDGQLSCQVWGMREDGITNGEGS
ncbi:exodeoxyribonuclease VII large subunit [Paenibacillus riograndensis]|uniref:Exodeoxyribonuclease 7 large subunit n=2 Tax=Paenibacillus riograndensis TaxID=483937 RepID=A0A0E4HG00_9BACL|nr:exodeoxyribonuclease VII large subunit [Paenibacillus riograndensis]CQR57075.1 Exodeoxyribonuclease 7 large subunit [Paenibacillus riograndensis SBR5]